MFHEVDPILGTLMVLMGFQVLNLILLVFYYIKLKSLSETIKEILGDEEEFHEYEKHVHPVLGSYSHAPYRGGSIDSKDRTESDQSC